MVDIDASNGEYAIGEAADKLIPLAWMNVPAPDQVIFRDASVYVVRWDFSRVGDGFASIEWIWDVISLSRLANILSFLNGATSRALYIRSAERIGIYPAPSLSYFTYSGVMWKPILSGQEGTPIARTDMAYQTVKLSFMDVAKVS